MGRGVRQWGAAGRFDEAFLKAFAPIDAHGKVGPAVYLNTTGADSGQRIVAGNVAYLRETIPGVVDLMRSPRRAPIKADGIPVREAVLNSARFTYVSPAGTVSRAARSRCRTSALTARSASGKGWSTAATSRTPASRPSTTCVRALAANGVPKDDLYVIVIDNANAPPSPARRPTGPGQTIRGRRCARSFLASASPRPSRPSSGCARARAARDSPPAQRFCVRDRNWLIDWSLYGDWDALLEAGQPDPALGWFLSTRSAKWMLERVDRVTQDLPFKLAACHQGKLSKEVRGLLGERDFPREHCPALRKE